MAYPLCALYGSSILPGQNAAEGVAVWRVFGRLLVLVAVMVGANGRSTSSSLCQVVTVQRSPIELGLPSDWLIECYGWRSATSLIVGYTSKKGQLAGGFAAVEMPRVNRASTHTLTWREVGMPIDATPALVVSPGGTKALGVHDHKWVSYDFVSGMSQCWRQIGCQVVWAPDSSAWLEVGVSQEAMSVRAHNLTRAASRRSTPLFVEGALYYLSGESEVIGFTKSTVLLTTSCEYLGDSTTVTLTDYSLGARAYPASTHRIRFPEGSTICDAAVSPDGKRVCWLVFAPRQTLSDNGGRSSHQMIDDRPRDLTIWVSDITGKGLVMSAVDSIGVSAAGLSVGELGGYTESPRGLTWSPDGQTIYYVNRRRIFASGVPPEAP